MTDKIQATQTEKQADKEQEPVQDRRKAMKKCGNIPLIQPQQ